MEKTVKFRDSSSTYEITDFRIVRNDVIFYYYEKASDLTFKEFTISIKECEKLGIFNFDKLRWILK